MWRLLSLSAGALQHAPPCKPKILELLIPENGGNLWQRTNALIVRDMGRLQNTKPKHVSRASELEDGQFTPTPTCFEALKKITNVHPAKALEDSGKVFPNM